MNIYIDTNILFTDPFFRSDFSKLLLNSSHEKAIVISIPSICLNELYFKLTTKARGLGNEINSKIIELNKWTNESYESIAFDLPKYEQSIRDFYVEKIENKIFTRLDYEVDYLKENLEKAIKKFTPFFTDKKEEFRDSIIWSIIREHTISNKKSKNYFVTANYSDFWNNEKTDLHPNLKKECDKIVIIDTIKKLFELEPILIDSKKRREFQEWLGQQNISTDMIQDAVNKYLWNHISETIDLQIKQYPIDGLKPEYNMGYIQPSLNKENYEIEKIEKIVPIEDFASIELKTSLRFEGKLFFPNYNKGDFSNYEINQFVANITLAISYDKTLLFRPISSKVTSIFIES
jgi:hypothetical protein